MMLWNSCITCRSATILFPCSEGKACQSVSQSSGREARAFHLSSDRRTSRQMDGLMEGLMERGDQ